MTTDGTTEKNGLTRRDESHIAAYWEGIKQGVSIYAWRNDDDVLCVGEPEKQVTLKEALRLIDAMRGLDKPTDQPAPERKE